MKGAIKRIDRQAQDFQRDRAQEGLIPAFPQGHRRMGFSLRKGKKRLRNSKRVR